jgi:hypothetical protein
MLLFNHLPERNEKAHCYKKYNLATRANLYRVLDNLKYHATNTGKELDVDIRKGELGIGQSNRV